MQYLLFYYKKMCKTIPGSKSFDLFFEDMLQIFDIGNENMKGQSTFTREGRRNKENLSIYMIVAWPMQCC